MKACMSSNIRLMTTKLAALERLKVDVSTFFSVAIDLIHCKLAGNEEMHNILGEFEFRPDYGVMRS